MVVKAVIDTNLVARAFILTPVLIKAGKIPPLYKLIEAFYDDYFTWVWSEDILSEYNRILLERLPSILSNCVINTEGYQVLETAIRLTGLKVDLTVQSMVNARKTLLSPGRKEKQKDPDDAHILATASEGQVMYITSDDDDILSLGNSYEGISIVKWSTFLKNMGYK